MTYPQVNRWLSIRLELLGNGIVLATAIVVSLLIGDAGLAGLALTSALNLTGASSQRDPFACLVLLWWSLHLFLSVSHHSSKGHVLFHPSSPICLLVGTPFTESCMGPPPRIFLILDKHKHHVFCGAGLMNWMVRMSAELEVNMNSVERMVEVGLFLILKSTPT